MFFHLAPWRLGVMLFGFCLLVAALPAGAQDEHDFSVSARVGMPVEIKLPPGNDFSKWEPLLWDSDRVEPVSIQHLPNETVFVFTAKAPGAAMVKFRRRAAGGADEYSQSERLAVLVMIEGAPAAPAARPAAPSMPPASSTSTPSAPAAARPAMSMPPSGSAVTAMPEIQDVIIGHLAPAQSMEELMRRMLAGQNGFPAQPPQLDTPQFDQWLDSTDTRPFNREFDLRFLRPIVKGWKNPAHLVPFPDTPPGGDTIASPDYRHVLELVRRELYDEATDALKRLYMENKQNKRVLGFLNYIRSHLDLAKGEYAAAADGFDSLTVNPDFMMPALFYRGYALQQKGDTIAAIAQYAKVLSRDPFDYFGIEAQYRMGRLYMDMRNYDRALSEYSTFLGSYVDSVFMDDVLLDMATLYDQIYGYQDFDKAIALYNRIISDFPTSPVVPEARKRKQYIEQNYF